MLEKELALDEATKTRNNDIEAEILDEELAIEDDVQQEQELAPIH